MYPFVYSLLLVFMFYQYNVLFYPVAVAMNRHLTSYTVPVLKVNIFMLFSHAQCCNISAAEVIYRDHGRMMLLCWNAER